MMPHYKQRSPEGAGYEIGEAEYWWEWCWESSLMRLRDKNAIEKNPAKMAELEEQKKEGNTVQKSWGYYFNIKIIFLSS